MAEWMSWTPDYSVHVRQIDEQHRELFRRFNNFLDAMWDGKGKDVLGENLMFLANYTVEHFGTEESFMRQFGYPEYQAHKQLHDSLVQEVNEFITRFRNENLDSNTVVNVANKLGDWVTNHIKGVDVRLGEFLSSRL